MRPEKDADSILYCTPTGQPERDIPLREIPAAIADLRAKWAHEFTRAEALDRENVDLKAKLDAMRARDLRNLDDLTVSHTAMRDQCVALQSLVTQRNKTIRDLERQLGDIKAERDHFERINSSGFERGMSHAKSTIQVAQARIDHLSAKVADYYSILCDLLAEHGTDCDECGGSGLVMDEEPGFDPSTRDGFVTRKIEVPCNSCFDGRTAK